MSSSLRQRSSSRLLLSKVRPLTQSAMFENPYARQALRVRCDYFMPQKRDVEAASAGNMMSESPDVLSLSTFSP
eukprot:6181828-Pleurochrysis_carterae.AAC.2